MGANFLSAEEIFLVRRLISSFSGFVLGVFWDGGVCLFGLDCRFSQTSLSLLAKNVISKRNVIFISSLSFAPLVDYFPYKGWERKREFLGLTQNKGKFFLLYGCGNCSYERETSY